MPELLAQTLNNNVRTRDLTGWEAGAEYVTDFDSYGGEGPNHDLVVVGSAAGGRTPVSVEAKATEHLGDSVQQTLTNARRRSVKTKVSDRIDLLPPE